MKEYMVIRMKLEIILALVLVTTLCSGHSLWKRETSTEADDVDVDVDVEETNDEAEKVEPAVDEGQGRNEQPIDVGLPVANAKQTTLEEDKRGMDVPFMSKPEVCTGWIEDFFDEYLVLREDRAAVFSDLQRFFIFMDDDGDSKISEEEFKPKWMDASGFGELDTLSLFYMFFTVVGDPKDENHIEGRNVEGIWEELFMSDIDGGELPKDYFSDTWQDILLPALPQHGCSGVNDKPEAGAESDDLKESAQIRPDVYGYYKRKRK